MKTWALTAARLPPWMVREERMKKREESLSEKTEVLSVEECG